MRSTSANLDDIFRTGQAYTVSEAADLARARPEMIRRWLKGLDSSSGHMAPVFGRPIISEKPPLMLSFLELIEVVVANQFRKGVDGEPAIPLDRIRQAHDYARRAFNVRYPFASLDLRQYGPNILYRFEQAQPGPSLIALDQAGQYTLPFFVQQVIKQFDYDPEFKLVEQWFPLGRDKHIRINPHIGAGRPTIVGTGVTTDAIRGRIEAGDSRAFVARDYGITEEAIDAALQYAA